MNFDEWPEVAPDERCDACDCMTRPELLSSITTSTTVTRACQHCLDGEFNDGDFLIGECTFKPHPRIPTCCVEVTHAVWGTHGRVFFAFFEGRRELSATTVWGVQPGESFTTRFRRWAERSEALVRATGHAHARSVGGLADAAEE